MGQSVTCSMSDILIENHTSTSELGLYSNREGGTVGKPSFWMRLQAEFLLLKYRPTEQKERKEEAAAAQLPAEGLQ